MRVSIGLEDKLPVPVGFAGQPIDNARSLKKIDHQISGCPAGRPIGDLGYFGKTGRQEDLHRPIGVDDRADHWHCIGDDTRFRHRFELCATR